jgi:hypothetical protein
LLQTSLENHQYISKTHWEIGTQQEKKQLSLQALMLLLCYATQKKTERISTLRGGCVYQQPTSDNGQLTVAITAHSF